MKLGASINLFDGIELLEKTIDQIRNVVDHISVVYQRTSNYGQPAPPHDFEYIKNLARSGKIDIIHVFDPNISLAGSVNELRKRNISLQLARRKKCTHFLSMDVDEIYKPDQLEYAKTVMVEYDFDRSVCWLQTYYKEPCYCFETPEKYFVPLIYKIRPGINFEFGNFYVLVDPTRKQKTGSLRIFERFEIEMHHLSYVRKNIRLKLENSSARVNFQNQIDWVVKYYDNWRFPMRALIAGNPPQLIDIKKVKPII